MFTLLLLCLHAVQCPAAHTDRPPSADAKMNGAGTMLLPLSEPISHRSSNETDPDTPSEAGRRGGRASVARGVPLCRHARAAVAVGAPLTSCSGTGSASGPIPADTGTVNRRKRPAARLYRSTAYCMSSRSGQPGLPPPRLSSVSLVHSGVPRRRDRSIYRYAVRTGAACRSQPFTGPET